MKLSDYYKQELQELRSLGSEFSRKNPGLSSFLSRKGQDPDVERLLEGFSFLAARLRQYFDEELPEVSHSLAQVLWPNYLRPLPSYSILKFDPPKDGTLERIPRGEEVMAPDTSSGDSYTFRTVYDVDVFPFDVHDVSYYTRGENGIIEIVFQTVSEDISLMKLDVERLRFYVGNHEHLSDNLYLHLLEHTEKMELMVDKNSQPKELGRGLFRPVGFKPEETVLPYSPNVFPGHIYLQEFFAYREKYRFVELGGMDVLESFPEDLLENNRTFTLRIVLSEKIKITHKLTREHFQLYCTPIVNLFESEADPIRLSHQEEYEVRPAGVRGRESEVFSIEHVQGWDSRTNQYKVYLPFESFAHHKEKVDYYATRVRLSEDGRYARRYIRFVSESSSQSDLFDKGVTVSLDILATNGSAPSGLSVGDISHTTAHSHVGVSFRNITVPTKSFPPPIQGDLLWRIISNMSLNHLSLEDVRTLRGVLEAYDFVAVHDHLQKKQTDSLLEGMEKIDHEAKDRIFEGLPVRGIRSHIRLNASKYSTLGEAYLFLNVLNEFLASYAPLNSFHQLEAHIEQKAKFVWPARMGKRVLL